MTGKSKQGEGLGRPEDASLERLRSPLAYGLLRPRLEGRYMLGELIARSGRSQVYAATDLGHENRRCVVKVADPLFATNLEREVFVAMRVARSGLRAIDDDGVLPDGYTPYAVFPWLEGETLAERLERAGPLAWEEAFRIGAQAAGALAEVHREGIVHRDLTPENLFLCDSGEVVVIDFGNAYVAEEPELGSSGELLGSPRYLPPEVLDRPDCIDRRADIYTLGLTLARAIAGEAYLPDFASIAQDDLTEAFRRRPTLAALTATLPPEAGQVLEKACALDPAARYGSMEELERVLEARLKWKELLAREATRGNPLSREAVGLFLYVQDHLAAGQHIVQILGDRPEALVGWRLMNEEMYRGFGDWRLPAPEELPEGMEDELDDDEGPEEREFAPPPPPPSRKKKALRRAARPGGAARAGRGGVSLAVREAQRLGRPSTLPPDVEAAPPPVIGEAPHAAPPAVRSPVVGAAPPPALPSASPVRAAAGTRAEALSDPHAPRPYRRYLLAGLILFVLAFVAGLLRVLS